MPRLSVHVFSLNYFRRYFYMPLVRLQVIKEQDWQPKSLKKLFIHGKGVVMNRKFCTTPLCFFLFPVFLSYFSFRTMLIIHSIGDFKVTNKETLFAASRFCWKRGGTEVKPIHFTNAG